MLALAEVDWTPDSKMNWERFLRKLDHHFLRLGILDVNYCDAVFNVEIIPEFIPEKRAMMIRLETEFPDAQIRYVIDAPEPLLTSLEYDTLFEMESSGTIRARAFVDGEMKGYVSSKEIQLHEAIGKPVYLKESYSERYPGGGDFGLVNGLHGSVHYGDGNWQGFSGTDIEVVIDMEKEMPIFEITVGFLQNITTWIFLPSQVTFLVSNTAKGGDFKEVATFENAIPMEDKESMVRKYSWKFSDLNTRYIKIIAKNPGPCPEWHPGAGSPSWVFIDEVVIE
jgi:hexosaminidase